MGLSNGAVSITIAEMREPILRYASKTICPPMLWPIRATLRTRSASTPPAVDGVRDLGSVEGEDSAVAFEQKAAVQRRRTWGGAPPSDRSEEVAKGRRRLIHAGSHDPRKGRQERAVALAFDFLAAVDLFAVDLFGVDRFGVDRFAVDLFAVGFFVVGSRVVDVFGVDVRLEADPARPPDVDLVDDLAPIATC